MAFMFAPNLSNSIHSWTMPKFVYSLLVGVSDRELIFLIVIADHHGAIGTNFWR